MLLPIKHHKSLPSHRIQIKLHDLNQLFNTMDPSPFYEKDLDADAEKFIVSWALQSNNLVKSIMARLSPRRQQRHEDFSYRIKNLPSRDCKSIRCFRL